MNVTLLTLLIASLLCIIYVVTRRHQTSSTSKRKRPRKAKKPKNVTKKRNDAQGAKAADAELITDDTADQTVKTDAKAETDAKTGIEARIAAKGDKPEPEKASATESSVEVKTLSKSELQKLKVDITRDILAHDKLKKELSALRRAKNAKLLKGNAFAFAMDSESSSDEEGETFKAENITLSPEYLKALHAANTDLRRKIKALERDESEMVATEAKKPSKKRIVSEEGWKMVREDHKIEEEEESANDEVAKEDVVKTAKSGSKPRRRKRKGEKEDSGPPPIPGLVFS